jgi:hypothetical protein
MKLNKLIGIGAVSVAVGLGGCDMESHCEMPITGKKIDTITVMNYPPLLPFTHKEYEYLVNVKKENGKIGTYEVDKKRYDTLEIGDVYHCAFKTKKEKAQEKQQELKQQLCPQNTPDTTKQSTTDDYSIINL